MKTYLRLMLWTGALTVAMTAAWTVAFVSWAQRHSQPPTIHRQLPATIDSKASTIDGRFVASTLDRTNKRYHLPDCSYAKLLKHGRGFDTEDAAQAAGYEPCSRCLPQRIARVAK